MAEIVVHFSRERGDEDECVTYCIFDADGNYVDDGLACEYDERDFMFDVILDTLDKKILEEG